MQEYSEEMKKLAKEGAEFYTMLLSNVAKQVIKRLGKEEGQKIVKEGLREFGLERGRIIRAKVDTAGLPPTLENFYKFYTVPTRACQKSHSQLTEKGRKIFVEYCAASHYWKKRGEEELGLLYCDAVDDALREGYNPKLKHENTKNPLRGDDICEHYDYLP